jgi:hypothetical protein
VEGKRLWLLVAGLLRRRHALVLAPLLAACAQRIAQQPPAEIVHRGVTISRGWSVSELAKGPALVHVYSESSGGTVYIAPSSGRTDECGRLSATLAEAKLEPDRRLTVAIRDGEVVCLQTLSQHPVEVLWHAHRVPSEASEYRLRPALVARKP